MAEGEDFTSGSERGFHWVRASDISTPSQTILQQSPSHCCLLGDIRERLTPSTKSQLEAASDEGEADLYAGAMELNKDIAAKRHAVLKRHRSTAFHGTVTCLKHGGQCPTNAMSAFAASQRAALQGEVGGSLKVSNFLSQRRTNHEVQTVN